MQPHRLGHDRGALPIDRLHPELPGCDWNQDRPLIEPAVNSCAPGRNQFCLGAPLVPSGELTYAASQPSVKNVDGPSGCRSSFEARRVHSHQPPTSAGPGTPVLSRRGRTGHFGAGSPGGSMAIERAGEVPSHGSGVGQLVQAEVAEDLADGGLIGGRPLSGRRRVSARPGSARPAGASFSLARASTAQPFAFLR